MYFKKLLPLLAAAILFVACGSNSSKKAFQYSEKITSKERALTPVITQTEEAIARFFNEEKNDSAKLAAQQMEAEVQKAIDEINAEKIPDGVKGGEEFKQAAIKYFEGIKSVYTSYSSLANYSQEDAAFQQESEKLIEVVDNKDKLVQDIVTAQQKFAQDNGFSIENPPA